MKNLLTYIVIVLTLAFAEEALASQSEKAVLKTATPQSIAKAKVMETWEGTKISLKKVKSIKGKKKNMLEVLRRAQIELVTGEVIYPEEVQYVIIQKSFFRSSKERVPHNDDTTGIGGVSKAPHGDD